MLAGHRTVVLVTGILVLLAGGGAGAQVMREPGDPLDALTFVDPRLRPAPAGAPFDSAAAGIEPEIRTDWTDFLAGVGGPWKSYVDLRTGRIDFAEGAGTPWLPGAAAGKPSDLSSLEARARAFLPRVARMMGIEPADLVLARERSGQVAEHLVLVDFDVQRDGLRVEGARVVFRVNNGNLVQFGTENLPSPGTEIPIEKIGRKEALSILADYVGGFSAADFLVDAGSALLVPLSVPEGHDPGQGRSLARVWELVFRRRGSHGTWRARIDATTGDLLELRDVNKYAQATGGVYPVSYIFADETVRPMPFADLSSGGFTNSAGQYSYGGGTVTSTLSGQFVDIFDTCGPISQSSGVSGNIAFGTSAGTDCTTPGSGGAGNTHAARTQLYHVNRIKEVGRGWLPASSWLSAQLPVNVNIFDVCNAYWNGTSINFFRSGSGCGNTGEIAGVSLHEYGHGLDDHDGIPIGDLGTAEAYADVTAALMLHDSCMGAGFFGGNCGGYGDACTSCSGVRDLDWAKHVSNTPHTVDNFTRLRCGSGGGYNGPCGGEGHCESYVASEAIWDLAARDLPSPGTIAAWMIAERLWYLSRPTATAAFSCNTSSIPWTSDGCTTGSWWRTMRAADDDDGNLANGTPHSCQLFTAFDRHGLACASDPGAFLCFAGCTPPAATTVTLTPSNHQVGLSWTSSGGGVTYDVFRSEAGCGKGFMKIADSLAGTSFTDAGLANGFAYSYLVVPHAAGNGACAAPPSACQSATPQTPPCPSPPPAPAGVSAATQGVDRLAVSWQAVPSVSEYQILRSASSGGPWSPVATVFPPATAHLDTGLEAGTTYYYVVRAATGDNCVSGDSNEASAQTWSCQAETLYENGFEQGSGLADWTVQELDGSGSAASWRGIQACSAHQGSKIFRFGGLACDEVYTWDQHGAGRPQGAAGFSVPAGSALTRLSFWHRRQFESSYDGGTLQISVDGGNYAGVPVAALSGAVYDGSVIVDCEPPGTAGTPIFTGSQPNFVQTTVDLDAACDAATGGDQGCGGHTVRIGFETITDCVFRYTGWFLDDVEVSTCHPHGCTGAPVIGTATAPADSQALVTWGNGTPASNSFNIYRALGSCANPGPFTRIASGVPGFSYLDSPVSGAATYAYRVSGLESTGACESDLSACADVATTGPCTLAPLFSGVSSAQDSGLDTCTLNLSWPAATSSCGNPVTYDVFRSTDPDFVPSPVNRIATGLTGTSFTDTGTLQFQATYTYVVRSVDSLNGATDTNTVRVSASPTGTLILPGTALETFEAAGGFDVSGWTHGAISGPDWEWSTNFSQSPTHSWLAPGSASTGDRFLVSPQLAVEPGTILSFWHTYAFEACYDGGVLEVSTNGGTTWQPVPASAFLQGAYNGQIYGSSNPLYGQLAWCSGFLGSMTEVRVDLGSLWAANTVRVRWHAGDDGSVASTGWYVDSVTLQNTLVSNGCISAPPPPLDFYTLTPCRLIDTRSTHAPALQPLQVRAFQMTEVCGVPATAKAVSVNLTVVGPGAPGFLTVSRADRPLPLASAINFQAGAIRANNAVLGLADNGFVNVLCGSNASLDFIVDVNGYFQE